MTIFEAISKRRSVRKFKNIPISDEIINEMLEAARLVPTSGNSQEHIIGVVKDHELKQNLHMQQAVKCR